MHAKNEKVYRAYVSKYNSKCEEQVITLIIPDKEGWHYIAVKILSVFLRGIMSKHNGDYYCLNCFNLFRTKGRLKSHIKVCRKKHFSNVLMPPELK